MCIPATSENQEAAEMFINFMCEVDIGKANAEYIGYTTPMQTVWEVLDEDLKYSEKSYDEGGSGVIFLLLLLAMIALACFNIWRKLRKKSRNMY